MSSTRTYSGMLVYRTFKERLEYLRLYGTVGENKFGYDRYMNQGFYTSMQWRRVRDVVIDRDAGCDLGITDYPIVDDLLVHHINPVTVEEIVSGSDSLLNLDNLITVSRDTHNFIHFGRVHPPKLEYIPRSLGDTKLW